MDLGLVLASFLLFSLFSYVCSHFIIQMISKILSSIQIRKSMVIFCW